MEIHWWERVYGPAEKDVTLDQIKSTEKEFKTTIDNGSAYICVLFSHNISGYTYDSYITSDDLDFCKDAGEQYFRYNNEPCRQALCEHTYFCVIIDLAAEKEVYFKKKEQVRDRS